MKTLALLALTSVVCLALAPPSFADSLQSETIGTHNQLRAKHGVAPLRWSAAIAKTAQAWADRCVFEHSSGAYGENLASGTTGGYSAAEFVQSWYDEVSSYDFATGASADGGETGHFTQVVWKGTTQFGCGLSHCADGNDMLVCNYAPAGNYDGQYLGNVPPQR